MKSPAKSERILRSVVACLSGALIAGVIGCDAVESGESQASRKVNAAADDASHALGVGDAEKAVKSLGSVDAGAGAAAKARAYSILAEAEFARAQPLLAQLESNQVKAAELAWDADQLLTRLAAAARTANALQSHDPQAVRQKASSTIKEIQGDANDAVWFEDQAGDADVPTLSEVNQRISRLEGEIAKRKERIAQLAEERRKVSAQAQEMVDKANQTPGQAGVELFRQATQLRQRANALGIQIESVNAELIPFANDLAVAQAQREVLERAVSRLQEQDKQVAEGWSQVGAQIDGQNQLARTILQAVSTGGGANGAEQQASVQEKLRALKELIDESDKLREQANQLLSDAAKNAASAAQQAQTLFTQLQAQGQKQSQSRPAFDAMRRANDANAYRLQQLSILQTLASSFAQHATMVDLAADLQDRLQRIAQETKMQLPQGLVTDLATQLQEARAAAQAAFEEAVNLAQTIKEAGQATPEQKSAARVASVITRYAWAVAAREAGDAATADQQLALARSEASEAVADRAVFPPLPDELNIPRASMATETPAPATPTGGEGAAPAPAWGAPAPAPEPESPTPGLLEQ